MTTPNLCPVCRQEVKRTRQQNIPSHFDSLMRDICPASGHPWRIVINADPEQILVAAS